MLALAPLSWRTVGLAAGLGAFALAAPAMAVPFTWDPAAAVSGADGTFTADNITVADYATVNVTSGGAFTENGLINLSAFTSGGAAVNLPGLGQNYGLYVAFTGAGTQSSGTVTPPTNGTVTGTFSSLNYTLYAASGKPAYGVSTGGPTLSGIGTPVAVANGSLITGTTALTNTASAGLSAAANVLASFNETDPAFFISPDATLGLNFFTSFNNTASVLSTSGNELLIDGGGGNATLNSTGPTPPVPEPASFAVLGAGLLGLAMARRQRLI